MNLEKIKLDHAKLQYLSRNSANKPRNPALDARFSRGVASSGVFISLEVCLVVVGVAQVFGRISSSKQRDGLNDVSDRGWEHAVNLFSGGGHHRSGQIEGTFPHNFSRERERCRGEVVNKYENTRGNTRGKWANCGWNIQGELNVRLRWKIFYWETFANLHKLLKFCL